MAIKVTGLFQNPSNQQIFQNPILVFVPHLIAWGKILLDVNILNLEDEVLGSFSVDINKNELVYDEGETDPYSSILSAIQSNVLVYLPGTNDINKNSNYANFIK